jgi:hypothetical protein
MMIERREPFTMYLTLEARSNEGTSPVINIKIAWNGKWHDGSAEMRNNLIIQDVTPEPSTTRRLLSAFS